MNDLGSDPIFELKLSLEFCLFLSLSLHQFMLNSLSLLARSFHDFLLLTVSTQLVSLKLFIKTGLIGHIKPKFKRPKIFTKNLQVNISITPSSETMKQIVKLPIIDIKVIFKEEFPELWNANVALFEIVEVLECIVRLYILDLFSKHFYNSKSFKNLNQ